MLFVKRYIQATNRILFELKNQFIHSTSPVKTALSIIIGFCAGLFPIFGMTTTLCILLTILFKANHLISVAVNFLLAPLQILLIFPFMRLGQTLFFPESQAAYPDSEDLFLLFEQSEGWYLLLKSVAGGIICWGIFSISTSAILYPLLTKKITRLYPSNE